MYENSEEKGQVIVRSGQGMRRGGGGISASDRYRPNGDRAAPWRGQAWGLASSQVKNRQDPTLAKKELFYGEKRPFTLDAPPEDPGSNFLSRVKESPSQSTPRFLLFVKTNKCTSSIEVCLGPCARDVSWPVSRGVT